MFKKMTKKKIKNQIITGLYNNRLYCCGIILTKKYNPKEPYTCIKCNAYFWKGFFEGDTFFKWQKQHNKRMKELLLEEKKRGK